MKVYVLSRTEYCHECAGMDIGSKAYANLDDAKAAADKAYRNMQAKGKYRYDPESLTWRAEEYQEYFDLEDTYFSGSVSTGAILHTTAGYSGFNIMEYEVI